ncbi:MAG TPA: sugar phosphate isomerase/epimerase, partial [Ignisphaera sp.]|nr:sugar phosphate isomerase/epimerase [Ignisphaera sp.]
MINLVWSIGLSHSIFWNYRFEEALRICSSLGIELFEIWADHPDIYPAIEDKHYIDRIRDTLSMYNFDIAVHSPCHDVNIASINPGIRRESIKQIINSIRLASELESNILVVHPGRRTTRYIEDSIYIANAIDSIKIIAREAQDYGVVIGIENMENNPRQFATKPEVIISIINSVNDPRVRMTFDIAHANTYMNPIEYYYKVKEYVVHVHLSNNYGQKTPRVHMPLYEGTIDIVELLKIFHKHGYRGKLVIEGGAYESLKNQVSKNIEYL